MWLIFHGKCYTGGIWVKYYTKFFLITLHSLCQTFHAEMFLGTYTEACFGVYYFGEINSTEGGFSPIRG